MKHMFISIVVSFPPTDHHFCLPLFASTRLMRHRQHFQGLRRAQHKTEVNSPIAEVTNNADPNVNPITRRPGPGRGRPKKQPPADESLTVQSDLPADKSVQPLHFITATPPVAPSQPSQPSSLSQPGLIPDNASNAHAQPIYGSVASPEASPVAVSRNVVPTGSDGLDASEGLPGPISAPPSQQLHLDSARPPPNVEGQPAETDDFEHPPKRQRLDEPTQEQSLDEEAVLALASHDGSSGVDPYQSEYPHPDAEQTGGLSHSFPNFNDT